MVAGCNPKKEVRLFNSWPKMKGNVSALSKRVHSAK